MNSIITVVTRCNRKKFKLFTHYYPRIYRLMPQITLKSHVHNAYNKVCNVFCIIYLPSSCSDSKLLYWQFYKGHWWRYEENQKVRYCSTRLCPAPGDTSAPPALSCSSSTGSKYSCNHTSHYINPFRASPKDHTYKNKKFLGELMTPTFLKMLVYRIRLLETIH